MHFSMRSAGVAAMLFGSLAAYPALAQTRPPDAPAQKKGLATKAIEAAKSAASAAGYIPVSYTHLTLPTKA